MSKWQPRKSDVSPRKGYVPEIDNEYEIGHCVDCDSTHAIDLPCDDEEYEYDGNNCPVCFDVMDSKVSNYRPKWSDHWDNVVCQVCADTAEDLENE